MARSVAESGVSWWTVTDTSPSTVIDTLGCGLAAFDEKPVRFSQTYKISYTPLLRQYRLSVGNVYQNFTTFDEVTRVLSKLRGVAIADHNTLKKDSAFQASVRLRLDTAQLPKPFQLNAIASRDWSLSSDWYRWSLSP